MQEIGTVILTGEDGYQEIIEAQAPGTRLVECSSLVTSTMYRLEWTDARGYPQNTAFYDWPSAEANFERRSTEA